MDTSRPRTFTDLRAGTIDARELRATPEALQHQANVARAAGRTSLADNFERGAELALVPEPLILEIYNALRPGRGSVEDLERFAAQLESEYGATRTAAFVREAALLR